MNNGETIFISLSIRFIVQSIFLITHVMYIRRTRFAQGFIQNSSFHCADQEEEEKQIEEKTTQSRQKTNQKQKGGLFSLAALIPAQNQYY